MTYSRSDRPYRAGVRKLHPEPAFDYGLNRWLPTMDEVEVTTAATAISSLEDWKREMCRLGELAQTEGRWLHASSYYRAAEFYMTGADPARKHLMNLYLEMFDRAIEGWNAEKHDVPYQTGYLPTLVFRAKGERRDTLTIHGGFDSYKEEFFMVAPQFAEAGFDVIVFDGPGQGQALRQYGLTMTPDWERPVGAVLDYFGVERCTLLGFSLGGYLAPRAAAFESRIERVIANDVLYDFLAVFAKRSGQQVLDRLEKILDTGDVHQADLVLEQAAQGGEVARWTVEHAKEVSGFQTGFEVLTWLRQIRTQPFAERIEQDFLLLGAQEDHIVPIEQFYRQIESLTKVRSLTAQLFTRADHAHTHCHVSNTALVVDFIVSWINFQLRAEAGRTHLPLV